MTHWDEVRDLQTQPGAAALHNTTMIALFRVDSRLTFLCAEKATLRWPLLTQVLLVLGCCRR
jgi:hypothetical protein